MELSRLEETLEEQQKDVERKEVEIEVKEELIEEKAEQLLEEGDCSSFFISFDSRQSFFKRRSWKVNAWNSHRKRMNWKRKRKRYFSCLL